MDSLKYILNNYRQYIKNIYSMRDQGPYNYENYTDYEKKVYHFIGDIFPFKLNENLNNNYFCNGSKGISQPPFVPWITIKLDKGNGYGFYVCYLFKSDLSGVYLSLALGVDQYNNRKSEIESNKNKFRELFIYLYDSIHPEKNFSESDEIELLCKETWGGNCTRPECYEKGTIFCKYYDLEDDFNNSETPLTNEMLKEDLNKFLELYNFADNCKIFDEISNENYSFESYKESLDKLVDEIPSERNVIYFGAPGTGKSFTLENDKKELLKCFENNYERVTFHPDYSYANFVGTYKPFPTTDKEGNPSITYKYVPGPFTRVLVDALNNPNEPFLLIIEEINRSNVAAVFGDVFQLLDRKGNISRYDIVVSEEMKDHLSEKLEENRKNDLKGLLGKDLDRIKIPQNMFIWATMNSADQGVFPMDTAFKRRWDFKYFGINHDQEKIEKTYFVFNGKKISWNKLRKAINKQLSNEEYKINEDKLLGPFFAFNEYLNKKIPVEVFEETFQNKIIMYLFEDAARHKRNELFEGARGDKNNITYSEICEEFKKEDVGLGIFEFIEISDILIDEED